MKLDTEIKWVIGIGAALIVLIVFLVVRDCQKKNECKARGGTVEKYNCRTQTVCTTVNKITTCTPQRVCKWRCIMPVKP